MSEIINNLQTCDILLCSGNSLASQTIRAVNKIQKVRELFARDDNPDKLKILKAVRNDPALELSHMALAVRVTSEIIRDGNWGHVFYEPGIYVWESTTGNANWSGVTGVQINPFDQWLCNYNGDVFARHLYGDARLRNMEIIGKMIEMIGMPYEDGIPGLFELGMTFNDDIRIDTPEIHCTEGGVIVMKHAEICTPDTDEHKMPPSYFGECGRFEDFLIDPIGAMVQIKWR